ncbi:ABC1 family-domain-containing protein [Sporodiniella umbellata]|nr:ABC1 family-domain-containing protein [Sporodiniella umbellata]
MLKIFSKPSTKRVFQSKIQRPFLYGTLGLGGCYFLYDDRPKTFLSTAQRASLAANLGMRVAIDYKVMQLKHYPTELEQQNAKSECHERSAKRVLDGLLKLGGIYVKLGQHISTMSYILPKEWTSTLAVLQDQCDPSVEEDIRKMFLNDCHVCIEDVFEEFDWHPLGVASLAQVHKARIGDQWVAVKFQHPNLDEFYRIDLQTVSFIIHSIKCIFPDFGFEWIMQEMKESLPQELDFEREAANAMQLKKNFENCSTALVVPEIIWAKSRILCMEFIEGARVDDIYYFEKHGINSSAVSTEITKIFSKMMFDDGFVHCDPRKLHS